MTTLFWLMLFGIAVGTVSGLIGIGGGVLMIPGLTLLFGLSQAQAQGTALAVMVPPIGIFAALVYYRNGYVQLPSVGMIALGFVLGAYLGAQLVPRVPVSVLRIGFGILLLYVGFLYVLAPPAGRSAAALPAGLATLAASIVALMWRRRKPPARPGDDIEYHI